MMKLLGPAILIIALFLIQGSDLRADSTIELERNSMGALSKLYRQHGTSIDLCERALAVLVFPEIHNLGAGLALRTASGVLFVKRRPADYFNLTGFSLGAELGIQKYGCVVFFMDEEALESFYKSSGFRLGLSGSVVIADELLGSLAHPGRRIQTFVFDQSGMMLSLGIQLMKITKYYPSK
jgi:lipid-binding SYLF domain-containing protein